MPKMRKSLWITIAVLLVSIAASNARADSYSANFLCTGPSAPAPTASNNPLSFPSPTIDVLWQGVNFVLTFNNPGAAAGDTYSWQAFQNNYQINPSNSTYSSELEFVLEDDSTNNYAFSGWIDVSFPGSFAPTDIDNYGAMVISPTATPEPTSVALLLAAAAFAFVMRKRLGLSLPQSS